MAEWRHHIQMHRCDHRVSTLDFTSTNGKCCAHGGSHDKSACCFIASADHINANQAGQRWLRFEITPIHKDFCREREEVGLLRLPECLLGARRLP